MAGRSGMKRAPRGQSFSSRNPTVIGTVGLVIIAVLLWTAFNAERLPIIGGGTVFTASFPDSAGLHADDEVRIAGVKVGSVKSVSLDGAHVKVKFRVKNAWIGDKSTVSIAIKTLLGRKYVAIDSQGDAKQDPKNTITKTKVPGDYDIYPVFSKLTQTSNDIDSKQLATAFTTIAATFKDTPADVKQTLAGLQRLSTTIASRDEALRTLLARANQVTKVLADRNQEITTLLKDGSLLFDELNARKTEISQLFVNTSNLSLQISGLVQDDNATLKPALDQLNNVLKILQNNKDSLDRGLALLAPFVRVFANTLGNGRWFDTYIQNLSGSGLLCMTIPIPVGGVC